MIFHVLKYGSKIKPNLFFFNGEIQGVTDTGTMMGLFNTFSIIISIPTWMILTVLTILKGAENFIGI